MAETDATTVEGTTAGAKAEDRVEMVSIVATLRLSEASKDDGGKLVYEGWLKHESEGEGTGGR